MGESIRSEAKSNAQMALDLDSFRTRYRDHDSDLQLEVIFPSGEVFAYEKNLFILHSRATKVPWNTEWRQRPDYVSWDYYGTTIFWHLILFVNGVSSLEDFDNLDGVLIPPYNVISDISRDRIPLSEKNELVEEPNNKSARMFKLYPLDDDEINAMNSQRLLDDPFPDTDDDHVFDVLDGGVVDSFDVLDGGVVDSEDDPDTIIDGGGFV